MIGYRIDIKMNDNSVLRDANITDAIYFAKGLLTRRTTKPGDKIELFVKEDPDRLKNSKKKKNKNPQKKVEENTVPKEEPVVSEPAPQVEDNPNAPVEEEIMNPPIESIESIAAEVPEAPAE